jgi:hypothetical protein
MWVLAWTQYLALDNIIGVLFRLDTEGTLVPGYQQLIRGDVKVRGNNRQRGLCAHNSIGWRSGRSSNWPRCREQIVLAHLLYRCARGEGDPVVTHVEFVVEAVVWLLVQVVVGDGIRARCLAPGRDQIGMRPK